MVHAVFVGKPEMKDTTGKTVIFKETGWKTVILRWALSESVGGGAASLTQDRNRWQAVVNIVMEPMGSIRCGEFLDYLTRY